MTKAAVMRRCSARFIAVSIPASRFYVNVCFPPIADIRRLPASQSWPLQKLYWKALGTMVSCGCALIETFASAERPQMQAALHHQIRIATGASETGSQRKATESDVRRRVKVVSWSRSKMVGPLACRGQIATIWPPENDN